MFKIRKTFRCVMLYEKVKRSRVRTTRETQLHYIHNNVKHTVNENKSRKKDHVRLFSTYIISGSISCVKQVYTYSEHIYGALPDSAHDLWPLRNFILVCLFAPVKLWKMNTSRYRHVLGRYSS